MKTVEIDKVIELFNILRLHLEENPRADIQECFNNCIEVLQELKVKK